jgi:hypothetical protein
MFNEGGLNSYMDTHNLRYFTGGSSGKPDQTHPNEEAYKKYYAPKLIKLFESLICSDECPEELIKDIPITVSVDSEIIGDTIYGPLGEYDGSKFTMSYDTTWYPSDNNHRELSFTLTAPKSLANSTIYVFGEDW